MIHVSSKSFKKQIQSQKTSVKVWKRYFQNVKFKAMNKGTRKQSSLRRILRRARASYAFHREHVHEHCSSVLKLLLWRSNN